MFSSVLEIIITIFCSVLASSGLWAFLMKKMERKDARTKMLLGLAHDRIIAIGMEHINKGFISNEEYEDLKKYLYDPYKELGGNGTAERIMREVEKLPM